MSQTYITAAARQELALREAVKTGNRHMRRKGRKLLRDVPPPVPWYAFEHPTFGTIGARLNADDKLEMKLPTSPPDDERVAVVEWCVEELKTMAASIDQRPKDPDQCSSDAS